MMCFGLFVFNLKSVPFQTVSENKGWNYPSNPRVNQLPTYQYTGKNSDVVTLQGVLYPEVTGGKYSLNLLERMADLGKAWPLIDGNGTLLGFFIMTEMTKTKSELLDNGEARKIQFTLKLKKVDPPKDSLLFDILGMI